MKKCFTIVVILFATVTMMCGCDKTPAQNVSIYDLQKAMLVSDITLPEMTTVNSSSDNPAHLFSYLSDIDYAKVDGFFLSYSADGLADEIAVIAMKNTDDVSDAFASLKSHVDGRINLYKSYLPAQVERAENALVFARDKYVVLIICDHPDLVRQALNDELDGTNKK
jgi:hypothetical protein